jgi:hypothetical protein
MESASQPESASDKPPGRIANLLGILIALITFALPLFAIAKFSSNPVELIPGYSYSLFGPQK